jgi:hypothetical protein
MHRGPRSLAIRIGPLLVAASLLAACGTPVVNPVTGKTERSVMDERTEIAEGAKAHKEVLENTAPTTTPGCRRMSTSSASGSPASRTAPT